MGEDAASGGSARPPASSEVLHIPPFAFFWSAATLRSFGGAMSGVAVQVLIVSVLVATPVQISLLSALGVLPYLFLGLIVGALMDRWRRQRTLVVATIGQAVVLGAVPARFGAGRAILLGRALAVVPWLPIAVLPLTSGSGVVVLLPVVAAAQFVYGLAMGLEDANDTGYRQSVAPDTMQGRMNSTIRTINRVVFFFGALLAGVLVTSFGYRIALGLAAVVFAAATAIVWTSPLRSARLEHATAP